jgi:hypothetical protein
MFQSPSRPRAYAEYVGYTTPSSRANALRPGASKGRLAGSTNGRSRAPKLYDAPSATDASVNDRSKPNCVAEPPAGPVHSR